MQLWAIRYTTGQPVEEDLIYENDDLVSFHDSRDNTTDAESYISDQIGGHNLQQSRRKKYTAQPPARQVCRSVAFRGIRNMRVG